MKELIDQLMELLQNRGYEMSPGMLKDITTLAKNLDKETETLADLLEQMKEGYEIVAEEKIIEYASYVTMKPKDVVFQDYGAFKLAQNIENQLQHELN